MSGQPTPPRLPEAFAIDAPDSSPASPIAGGRTNPFPTASQIGITNGAASLHDGFPPLTMTSELAGGIPPFGVDANGILYLLSAHVAAIAAGQPYLFDATLAADMGGYKIGAVLAQEADPNAFWINTLDGNTSDPDTASPLGSNNWYSTKPLRTSVTAGGNNIALPGASDYVWDVDATSGAITITGFVSQRDGQRLTIRKIDSGGNAVTLSSLSGSSSAANQLQIVSPSIALPLQYMAVTILYNSTVGKWIQV
jgi:hypothetical protein